MRDAPIAAFVPAADARPIRLLSFMFAFIKRALARQARARISTWLSEARRLKTGVATAFPILRRASRLLQENLRIPNSADVQLPSRAARQMTEKASSFNSSQHSLIIPQSPDALLRMRQCRSARGVIDARIPPRVYRHPAPSPPPVGPARRRRSLMAIQLSRSAAYR